VKKDKRSDDGDAKEQSGKETSQCVEITLTCHTVTDSRARLRRTANASDAPSKNPRKSVAGQRKRLMAGIH
jgi:hypothetical protein